MRPHLLRWQWEGYAEFHRGRINLWIHPPAVSLFVAGVGLLLYGAVTAGGRPALAGLAAMVVGFVLQAVGHKREATPPIPFAGPLDGLTRIFAEQLITFPRFFFSGGWGAAMKNSKSDLQRRSKIGQS